MTEQIQGVQGGWSGVKLSDIQLEKSGFAPIPVNEYVFQLVPGASFRTKTFPDGNSVTELNVPLAIAEGELRGRRTFINYPDPTSTNREGKPKTWSKQALKKLEITLGVDAFEDEAPDTYLNRVATSGVARFAGKMEVPKKPYIKPGNTEPETELNIWSVRPAA